MPQYAHLTPCKGARDADVCVLKQPRWGAVAVCCQLRRAVEHGLHLGLLLEVGQEALARAAVGVVQAQGAEDAVPLLACCLLQPSNLRRISPRTLSASQFLSLQPGILAISWLRQLASASLGWGGDGSRLCCRH